MTTILIKKKDTAGAPAAGDLTNAAGGAEIAVNTATKRIYTKDSGGTVVEVGTFPSTMAVQGALSATGNVTLGDASADSVTVNGTITSNLIFTDATYDIGASGATRPRDLFLSRNLTVGGTMTVTGGINFNGNVTVGDSSADTLTINSTITSNLIFTDNTYDIGASGANRPRSLYLASTGNIGGNLLVKTSTARANITTDANLVTENGLGILSTSTTYGQGYQYIRFVNSAAAYAGSVSQTASTAIGLYSAGDLTLGANSTAGATLTSAGNFLVGTQTLTYGKLVVLGATSTPSLTVGTTATAIIAGGSGQELAITESGAAPYAIGLQARNSTGGPSGTSYPILINPLGGNVGIGTVEPQSKLHIDIGNISGTLGQANQSNILLGNAGASAGNLVQMLFGYVTSAVTYAPAALGFVSTSAAGNTKGDLIFGTRDVTTDTAPSERLRIDSSGNVGIGTSSPSVKLDVVGTSGTEQFRIGNTTGGTDFGITVTENNTTVINSAEGATGRGIQFQSGGTNTVLIDSSGKVGIATTDTVSLLTVATGQVTNRGQWASSAIALYNPTNVGVYSQISFGYTTGTTNAAAYMGFISTNQGANGYGDLVFGTRSVTSDTQPTERMRISSAGYLTVPATPAFAAYGLNNAQTGSYVTTLPAALLFSNVSTNNESCYNSANGRFTAPVAGLYYFSWSILVDNDGPAGSITSAQLYKNGGSTSFTCYNQNPGTCYIQTSQSMTISLSASDYVVVQGLNGYIHTGSETAFTGYLIG